ESDHHECNDSDMSGCPRCKITAPATCCNIHDASAFSTFGSLLPKPPRASQCSHLPKYTKDKKDYKLEEVLLDWHKDKTVAIYRWACLNDHGAIVMTNTMLNRIIDCVHHQKILTCQDLKRETGWMNSDRFGDEVVKLIQQHAMPTASLLVSTPLRHRGAAIDTELADGPLSLSFRCSACGQEGHNARNQVCPKHPSHVSTSDKENVSPPTYPHA
ncbi:hypothetical protein BKA83DRAFT_4041397, partial [Pisolithus microcarpus]